MQQGRRRSLSPRRLVALLALSVGFVLLLASPASAHASLLESNPVPGAVLQQVPKLLTLTFSEPIDVRPGAIRVYSSDSERVDHGGAVVINNRVEMPFPKLGDGAYVVTWRVTSADSHPVAGAFTVQIGTSVNASSPRFQGLAQRLLGSEGGDRIVGVAYGAVRWLVFGGLALVLGCAGFGVLVSPAALRSARTARWVWIGWLVTLVGSVLGVLLDGPYISGLGLGDITQTDLIGETLDTRFGQVWVFRIVLLLLAVPVLRALLARRGDESRSRSVWVVPVAAPLAVALAATPGLAGHAATGDWVTVAVFIDTLHVLAMAIWLGGLLIVASVLLPGRSVEDLRDPLTRWSRVAFVSIAAVVVSGGFQTWRQVRTLDALRGTDYGRMLIVKLVVFAVLLAVAAFSREIVLRLFPGDPADRVLDEQVELRRLRRAVGLEVLAAVAILAVTSLLVNAAPAKTAFGGNANTGAIGVTLPAKKVWVDITLTPGKKGTNDVHVSTIAPNGAPKVVQDLTITFALPDRKIASIKVPLRNLGTGHYLSPGFEIPIAGTWSITAKPLLSEFNLVTITGELEVGG